MYFLCSLGLLVYGFGSESEPRQGLPIWQDVVVFNLACFGLFKKSTQNSEIVDIILPA